MTTMTTFADASLCSSCQGHGSFFQSPFSSLHLAEPGQVKTPSTYHEGLALKHFIVADRLASSSSVVATTDSRESMARLSGQPREELTGRFHPRGGPMFMLPDQD
ncbi:transcriptional regulator [Anopheles sinensis]|uniref:Transcriptional regulator n=1 Tax=Anopheles sinensis TaxID=74873 RepID=A0A084W8I2_ANOSI|nr:transcriptional regulator [Anopheles sinensis]